MIRVALVGNPNSGKTTLFNTLTGSTAHVGNWPGVTVDKREGIYKNHVEDVSIIDLPGIYSLSPYTSEEVISRNFILDEKPDCIINIVDATNIERNLYLTTQLLEIDVPIVIALNMIDMVKKSGVEFNIKELEEKLRVPVIEISALRQEGIKELIDSTLITSNVKRSGSCVINNSPIGKLVKKVEDALISKKVDYPLFHAIKLIENDEIEIKDHCDVVEIVNEFKKTYKDDVFGNDFEAMIANERYNFITDKVLVNQTKINREIKETSSDKADKVMTHKIWGIPLFLLILFAIFHLTFTEDFLFLGGLFEHFNVKPCFEGSVFEGLFWTKDGINSPGVIFFNFVDMSLGYISGLVESLIPNTSQLEWVKGLVVEGVLGGIFSVLSFVPQILVLFLLFSILEDSGYMARVAFILDRIFRRFGLSGRAFMPMIMGFGCSVPAMINTRTLGDDNEKIATLRVIPFFSCGAKLPILTAIAGGIVQFFNIGNTDLITYSMYVLGVVTAIVTVLLMRKTVMRGDIPPFIMELPAYHLPQFKSLMIHLWDKLKHYVQKAFTIILASTIVIWFLSNFAFTGYVGASGMDNSILAMIGKIIQPLFTPLGFGIQLEHYGWVFAVAAITGLIAKENVVSTFYTLACCIIVAANGGGIPQDIIDLIVSAGEASESGEIEAIAMIAATGIGIPGLLSFIAFNMTTIPCFASVATAKAELPKGKFITTILFWLITSFVVSMMIYIIGTWWWTSFIFLGLAIILIYIIYFGNKYRRI